jgi:hypothetical protein
MENLSHAKNRIQPANSSRMVTALFRLIFTALLSLFSLTCFAADTGNLVACNLDLKELIVPKFKTKFEKKDVFGALVENNNGVYSVKMYLCAGRDAGEVGCHRIPAGWVHLDTVRNKAFDVTYDDENNSNSLDLDAHKYKQYMDKCITGNYRDKEAADEIITTNLPFRLDGLLDCYSADVTANECVAHYHQYPINWIDTDLRALFDSSVESFFALPSIFKFRIFLAAGAQKNVLYVFDGSKLISKRLIGQSDDKSNLSFDINKEYLVTTYLRVGEKITRESKIKEVLHQKLNANGEFVTCPNSNPTCK